MSNASILRTRRDSGLSLALPFQLPGWMESGSWNWLPAHSAREGTAPRPCPACARGSACVQPACLGGLRAKGNLIVFPTHMFYSLQPTAFRSCCLLASRRLAVLQDHTRPGTLPVTLFSLPTQGLWRAEMMGPTQNWPLLIFFRRVLECPSWKGPGSSASSAPGYTDRGQAHI